jgi:alkanesulfonate monooxygenase SsuD/methylene tetrahydromethanopterin reductase-like flavin-dependent oxidoreductase (luciferase family)
MTDEATELIVRLWTQDDVTFEGRFFSVRDLTLRPKPVQEPHPDVWFGGHSEAACRRVARLGTGWLPSFIAPSEYRPKMEGIQVEAEALGREIEDDHYGALVVYLPNGEAPDALLDLVRRRRPEVDPHEIIATGSDEDIRTRLAEYIEAGATKFVLVPATPPANWGEELERVYEKVVSPLEN